VPVVVWKPAPPRLTQAWHASVGPANVRVQHARQRPLRVGRHSRSRPAHATRR
jgi:hypothetical protein